MKMRFIQNITNFFTDVLKTQRNKNISIFRPFYRVVEITKDKHGDFEVLAQIIGKNTIFKMKPEEILANDKMTDLFSPRDVRTLTYLGYLDINSPKYRILAKRLSEQDDRMLFALTKKGSKNPTVKTAAEISKDKKIIKQLDQVDAHMIGYTAATESILEEKLEQKKALQSRKLKDNR